MRQHSRLALLSLLSVAALAGCASKPAPVVSLPEPVQSLTTTGQVATDEKADYGIARNDGDIVLQLDIYQLTVPCGAISCSDRFWKHIDEDHVDLETHALLLKNGVRFGVAPNDEWDYFKTLMDHYGATAKKGSASPVKKGSLELPMRSNIESQDIFYLDPTHQMPIGRSYEKCDNLLALTFEPTPRRPGDSRIAVCAMVRGLRQQFVVTVLNEVRDIELKNPEYLYDLRLKQDVPLDHFLVIAPAKLAALPDSLGQTFFITPGGAEPKETVLLLVPRPFRLNDQATSVPMNHSTGVGGK